MTKRTVGRTRWLGDRLCHNSSHSIAIASISSKWKDRKWTCIIQNTFGTALNPAGISIHDHDTGVCVETKWNRNWGTMGIGIERECSSDDENDGKDAPCNEKLPMGDSTWDKAICRTISKRQGNKKGAWFRFLYNSLYHFNVGHPLGNRFATRCGDRLCSKMVCSVLQFVCMVVQRSPRSSGKRTRGFTDFTIQTLFRFCSNGCVDSRS